MIESQPDQGHIHFLDGLRGIFATWVFVFHTAMFVGWFNAPVPPGGLAVDAFMLLSGLLMTHLFIIREERQPLASRVTIGEFYARRFFRIAPLYFALLIPALILSSMYSNWLAEIWRSTPPPWAASLSNDPSDRSVSLWSVLSHVTFTFGLIPKFAANNVLPDWSLSLEMQFYLVFPFLVLASRRVGWVPIVLCAIVIQAVTHKLLGLYLEPKYFGLWPQPSFIFFKIVVFMIGALIAVFIHGRRDGEIVGLLILSTWASGGLILSGIAAIVLGLAVSTKNYGPVRRFASKTLSLPVSRLLGDVSYGVYLLHMMLLTPVCAILNRMPAYFALPAALRFLVVLVLTSLCLFPTAYLLHRVIEMPGIRFGRMAVAKLTRLRKAA